MFSTPCSVILVLVLVGFSLQAAVMQENDPPPPASAATDNNNKLANGGSGKLDSEEEMEANFLDENGLDGDGKTGRGIIKDAIKGAAIGAAAGAGIHIFKKIFHHG